MTIRAMRAVCMGSAAVRLHHSGQNGAAALRRPCQDERAMTFLRRYGTVPPPRVRADRGRARADHAGEPHGHLLRLGARHPAARRDHRPRDRGPRRAPRRRHRRPAQRHLRQCRRADHRRARAARRPVRSRQGVADRVDHRQRAARVRRVGVRRRPQASDPALQPHRRRPGHDDAAAEHDRAGRAGRVPPAGARRAAAASS